MLQKQQRGKKKKGSEEREAGWFFNAALGKLHTIAVLIQSSTLLTDEWITMAHKALGINNATRWNSWYTLIVVALQKQEKLMVFCNKRYKELGSNILTADNWELFRYTREFLEPFTETTLIQQTRCSSLDQALHTMDILFRHYKEAKVCHTTLPRYLNILVVLDQV